MVHKIINHKFGVFVESLILTLLIFIIGFSLGFYIEFSRTNDIIRDARNYEIEALDLRLQNYYYQTISSSDCQTAIEQNFIFADNLYSDGLEIQKYEEASQLTEDIRREKRRYVLLKTELWLNSIILKEKCNADFDTIVYFYSDDPNNNIIVSQQKIISNVLKDIKEENGNSVILLPIAGDMGLEAIDLQRRVHKIGYLPSILINEDIVLEGFHTVDEIRGYLS